MRKKRMKLLYNLYANEYTFLPFIFHHLIKIVAAKATVAAAAMVITVRAVEY